MPRLRDQCWAAPVSHGSLETAVSCLSPAAWDTPTGRCPASGSRVGIPVRPRHSPRTQPSNPSPARQLALNPCWLSQPASQGGRRGEERHPALCTVHHLPLRPLPGIPAPCLSHHLHAQDPGCKADGPGGTEGPQGHRGQGHEEYSSPRRAQGTTGLGFHKGLSPSVFGAAAGSSAPQGWAEGRTGIRSDFSWGPCACTSRPPQWLLGDSAPQSRLGVLRGLQGPQRHPVCPLPIHPLHGASKGASGSSQSPRFQWVHPQPGSTEACVHHVGLRHPPQGAGWGQRLCRNHVQRNHPLPAAPAFQAAAPPPEVLPESSLPQVLEAHPGSSFSQTWGEGHAPAASPSNPCPGWRPGAQAWG